MALTPALLKEITEVLESMDDNQLKDAEFMLNYLRKLTPEQREEFNRKVDARLKELDEMDAQATPPPCGSDSRDQEALAGQKVY